MKLNNLEFDEQRLRELCQRNAIRKLSIFGSVARGDARADSDVDVIIEINPPDTLGLLELGGLQLDLTELFGRQVHLHTPNMIHPYLRDRIHKGARVAYAA